MGTRDEIWGREIIDYIDPNNSLVLYFIKVRWMKDKADLERG